EVTDGVRVVRVNESARFPTTVHPAALRRGRRLLTTDNYDVVHVHAGLISPFAFAAASAASSRGLPTVLTVHSLAAYLEPGFRLLDAVTRWSSWPVAWTAVSEIAAEPLRRILRGRGEVLVLPNGVDASRWQVQRAPKPPDDVLIVAVMRLAPRKRPLHLLRMLRQVRTRVPETTRLRAVIVGEGPERPSLERYLGRHHMTDWVSLPGRFTRDEIRALFARADLSVAPATLESFGIAALEARCAGLPVVARRDVGISEFITDGREGVLVEDDVTMVEAISKLSADPTSREALAEHNRLTPPSVTWRDVLQRADQAYAVARGLARPTGLARVGAKD
ncbi:MAG: glycosyltransferase family 4 protein, partial [Nocardioidaceae bacterium]